MLEQIEKIAVDFFSKLQINITDLEVISEDEKIFNINIKTEESGLLIGTHWKNLEIITTILKLILLKNIWDRIIIHIEVNDYLKQKDEKLYNFIRSKIEQIEKYWKDITLPFFTAYERKKIHSFVSDLNNNIFTRSEWEGKDRRLCLWKEAEKLTIDIDWSDI